MVTVTGVRPNGAEMGGVIWAVKAAWGSRAYAGTQVEQRRANKVLASWVIHQVPDGDGWALLWGKDNPEIKPGDTIDLEEDVGLGDVVANATRFLGVKPCGGCKKRQEWLNRRVPRVYRRRR